VLRRSDALREKVQNLTAGNVAAIQSAAQAWLAARCSCIGISLSVLCGQLIRCRPMAWLKDSFSVWSEVWAGIWAVQQQASRSAEKQRLFGQYGGEGGIPIRLPSNRRNCPKNKDSLVRPAEVWSGPRTRDHGSPKLRC